MLNEIAPLLGLTQAWLMQAFIIFLRVGAAMAFMPAFGEQMIPVRVRLIAGFAFTLLVLPSTPPLGITDEFRAELIPSIIAEPLIGLTIGLMLRLFVISLQVAGMIIAQSISLGQLFGAPSGEPQPVISTFLLVGGLACAIQMDLPINILRFLQGSYAAFPIGTDLNVEIIKNFGIENITHTFNLALSIASPFIAIGLIYNITLGAINRAIPQLMVALVGAPYIISLGIFMLALISPLLISVWLDNFSNFILNSI